MQIDELAKIPDIFTFDRFLIFEPHSDDADIFVGGLIKKLSNMKKEIIFLLKNFFPMPLIHKNYQCILNNGSLNYSICK